MSFGTVYDSEEQLSTHINLVTQNENLWMTVYILSGLSLILLILAIFFGFQSEKTEDATTVNQVSSKQEKQLKSAQDEIENLRNALQKERSSLVAYEVKMRELQAYIEELKAMQASTEIRHKTIEMQQKFGYQKSEDLAKKLMSTAQSLYPEIVKELENKFPEINTLEFQYCMMLVLGYNSEDVMATLNRSEKAIKSLRYRIRKKLGLDESQGLKEFLIHLNSVKTESILKN